MPIFRGKNFVSSVSDYKDSVRVAVRSNINLSGTVTIVDGVTLSDKDRVLIAGQSVASQNGIYVWSSSTSQLTRAEDADSAFELSPGNRVYVEEGNSHSQTNWVLITTGIIVPGVTSIVFAKESHVVDGVTLSDKDRVLIAGQSVASQNGIYVWSSSTSQLTRAEDADSAFELSPGNRVYVEEGNSHSQTNWVLITTGIIVPGVTSIVFAKESHVGPVAQFGTFGAANKTLQVQIDESGQVDSVTEYEIDLDGGEF